MKKMTMFGKGLEKPGLCVCVCVKEREKASEKAKPRAMRAIQPYTRAHGTQPYMCAYHMGIRCCRTSTNSALYVCL
eukprot:619450-Rhodomonas_salina.1